MNTRAIKTASLLAVILFICVILVTQAEWKTVGDLYMTTYKEVSTNEYFSQTTDTTGTSYFLSAHLRAWGSTPNPLKAESFDDGINISSIRTPNGIWTGYNAVFPAQHRRQSYPGGSYDVYYTSSNGFQSTYCWFTNGYYGGC